VKTREDAERVLELFAEPDRFKKATDHGVRTLAVCATRSHEALLLALAYVFLRPHCGHQLRSGLGSRPPCLWFFYRLFRS
jgi:hypothetical protein